jgi:hypothetical protein
VDRYKKLYTDLTHGADTISTVDHIFASPPTRLVDSHAKAMQYNADIIIIDSNKPEINKYKCDLIVDSGIYSSNNSDYYIYDTKKRYFENTTHIPRFDLQLTNLRKTLESLQFYTEAEINAYTNRFEDIINIYSNLLNLHNNPYEFYVNLMAALYRHLHLNNHASYFMNRSCSLSNSPITTQLIPEMIKITQNTKYSLQSLIENDIIKNPCYISPYSNKSKSDIKDIADQLINKCIVPNYELVLWATSLCGVKHFGNDLGFHTKFSSFLEEIGIENNIASLQLSEHKKDGGNFVEFNDVFVKSINKSGTHLQSSNIKQTRVDNLCSLYCHVGSEIENYWKIYNIDKVTTKLSMKDIRLDKSS